MKTRGKSIAYVLYSLLVVLAAACSDPNDLMHGWVGRDWNELANAWGQPSEEIRGDDASRTIIYVSYWSDGFFETHVCRRVFTTDSRGTIRVLSSSGC
jgi:hypothetical protein